MAAFTPYDVPAYETRRFPDHRRPARHLDWWPRAEAAAIAQEAQHQKFWLHHGFRRSANSFEVLQSLYAAGHDDEYVVALWIAAASRLLVRSRRARPGKPLIPGTLPLARAIEKEADLQLPRLPSWRQWIGGTVYVLPEQPEGFLANVAPELHAVMGAIIDEVVKIHRKYVLVALHPRGPLIPDPRVEGVALAALQTLTDEEFERVIAAEFERRGRPATRKS